MPQYWGKNYFAHGSFPEVGQKQKTEKKERRKREGAKVGDNNGQATHGARKHAWRTQARMAHASRLGHPQSLEYFLRFLLLTHFEETPMCEIISPPIFNPQSVV